MTALAVGALLAVAAMVWVIAPVFASMDPPRDAADLETRAPSAAADDAAEAAIRKWRRTEK
ncbi:MAG TPA: hypothetical protein VGQ30_01475 [Gemmatimonadaceae bacterium]|nr:hypothetical protein [Gemmatimonadaceae bacterium]